MRYSVRFENSRKIWLVGDCGDANRTLGEHRTKAAAYAQAGAEQERWAESHSGARNTGRLGDVSPRSLVYR